MESSPASRSRLSAVNAAVHNVWLTASCSSRDEALALLGRGEPRDLAGEPSIGDRRRRLIGDCSQTVTVADREETFHRALGDEKPDLLVADPHRCADDALGWTERPSRTIDDDRADAGRQTADHVERRQRFAEVRLDGDSISESHSLTSDVGRAVLIEEEDRGEIVGHQTLDPTEHVFHHLVEIQGARHRRRAVAERFGIRTLLTLLGLDANPILDLTTQALVGSHQLGGSLLDPLVELGEGSLQVVLGGAALGDVLEGAEHADHDAREVTQRNLVGLDPAHVAGCAPQPFDDAEPRLS